jgi:hypothetical protein
LDFVTWSGSLKAIPNSNPLFFLNLQPNIMPMCSGLKDLIPGTFPE